MNWHRFNDQFRETFWERQERQRKARNAARTASAIDARSDATGTGAAEGESAAAESRDANNITQSQSYQPK